jgi:hypothetical protein
MIIPVLIIFNRKFWEGCCDISIENKFSLLKFQTSYKKSFENE